MTDTHTFADELDPQEALDSDHDPSTDVHDDGADAPLTPQDEQYTPEDCGDLPVFDAEGWPGDVLVITDLDGINDDEEDED